ncbi:NifU family protein [Phaeovulum sp.]|uniref:NifU family protein n=1 Tax=Phaeovulum sp. TaxID=2934796 RepID=UPI0039E5C922
MSETTTPRRIQAQASPRDPQTMRFILDAAVQAGQSAGFDSGAGDAPLAQALFAIEGVRKVQVSDATILVTRAPESDWQALKAPIAAAIRLVLDSTDHPLGMASTTAPAEGSDEALLAAVTELLDNKANPAIASHGGRITAEGVEGGTVYLRMSGGCQGCAASAMTLRNGVETMLRAALPAIREIVDVTDHATGTNPFYRGEPGQSPSFSRPVPPEAIGWEEGQMIIDPDYLAPKLGLDADALEAGLARGDIVITSEKAPDSASEKTRVTVRSATRAWAAEVLPDGSAREIPPPRALSAAEIKNSTLPKRVRRYLEALAPEKLPITYGALARGLGMYAPGSIRKVTGALETTMHEDRGANRPFIAARVVGRGSAKQPGQGFFALARALGRGPRPDESDLSFHQRQLAESLAGEWPIKAS